MQIQNGNHRLFEDFDPILWKEAEEAGEENKQFLTSWGKTRAEYLYKLAKSLNKNSDEYYETIARLVDLCQNGPLGLGHSDCDKEWVNHALSYLADLYTPLIKKISYWAFHRYSATVPFYQLEDFESLTRMLLERLVLGDSPWAIDHFKEQEKHSPETYQHLAEIHIHKRWRGKKEYAEELEKNLVQKLGKEDMRVVKFVLDEMLVSFAEAENQPLLDFKSWIRWNLHHEIEKSKIVDHGQFILKVLANHKLVEMSQVIQNDKTLDGFINQYHECLLEAYEIYRKSAYKDRKFPKNSKYNFTAFVSYNIRLLIKDFFKRKEFNADKNTSRNAEVENLPDTKPNEVQDALETWLQTDRGQRFLHKLTEREQQIARMCLLEGMKQVHVANTLGISKGRVSQLLNQIKVKIKPLLQHPI